MANKVLAPAVQKEVVFYEDMITAVLVEEKGQREVYVSIRQMCELLGVSYQGQIRRINDDPVLSKQVKGVNITFTPSSSRGGGVQETNCLPLDYLNGWLFGINAKRVKEEVRERLILYQERCYKVLTEAFQEGRLTAGLSFEDLLANDTPAAQAYKIAAAIMKMARQQLLLESQLETHADRLVDHEQRLEEIEATLGDPGRLVTPDQAMQISQAVKAVAIAYGKQTRKNEFGGVYGELYRREGITSYKQLPGNRFQAVMEWLADWYSDVTNGDGLPF
ncbi:MAG: hypothetical protein M5U34_47765 [Chloroflexi bacterium]|nr:hypothetical protein [Chloroflexota bacterium]